MVLVACLRPSSRSGLSKLGLAWLRSWKSIRQASGSAKPEYMLRHPGTDPHGVASQDVQVRVEKPPP